MKFFKSLWLMVVTFFESAIITPVISPEQNVSMNMAKVKLSALVSGISGKLNGSVFAKNRGGLYLRTKVTPVNPQTAAQVAARNLLTSFSQGWKSLTIAQRTAWNNAVENFQTTDIFGDLKKPTGLQLYIRLNANISNGNGTPITSPPLPSGAPALTDLSLSAAVTLDTFDVTFAPTPVPADTALYLEATTGLSAGVNNANSLFRTIDAVAAAATSPEDAFAAYTAKFGALVEGQKIFIRAKFINLLTGEVSLGLVASDIVGA